MKVLTFGCSFMSGEELSSPNAAWSAQIAKQLSLPHVNHARAGIGNLQILHQILCHADPDSCCIINWSWIDRFDFCSSTTERWETIRPSLEHPAADFYYRNLHGQYQDMLNTLIYINSAMDFLDHLGARYLMTYIDPLIFETVDPTWHDPVAVSRLQNPVRHRLHDFQGDTFLNWSRARFAVSEKWHPLDEAHAAAAGLMLPVIDTILHRV
jgi:hypothetical protein